MNIIQFDNLSNAPCAITSQDQNRPGVWLATVCPPGSTRLFVPLVNSQNYTIALLTPGPTDQGPGTFFWIWQGGTALFSLRAGETIPFLFASIGNSDADVILVFTQQGSVSGRAA